MANIPLILFFFPELELCVLEIIVAGSSVWIVWCFIVLVTKECWVLCRVWPVWYCILVIMVGAAWTKGPAQSLLCLPSVVCSNTTYCISLRKKTSWVSSCCYVFAFAVIHRYWHMLLWKACCLVLFFHTGKIMWGWYIYIHVVFRSAAVGNESDGSGAVSQVSMWSSCNDHVIVTWLTINVVIVILIM